MFIPPLRPAALTIALLPYLATAGPLSLEAALQLAFERSETVRAARAGAASATEMAQAASQLPDPTLRVGVDNLPSTGQDCFHTTRDSMTMKRIAISQEWLSAEKRAARQAAAHASVAGESVQVRAAAAADRSSLLETVQAGDKVRFVADKIDGKFTVTNLEVAR